MFYKHSQTLMFLALSLIFTGNVSTVFGQVGTLEQDKEKVDSTLLFRQIPTEESKDNSKESSALDIFNIPEIELPSVPSPTPNQVRAEQTQSIPSVPALPNYPLPEVSVPASAGTLASQPMPTASSQPVPSAPSIPGIVAIAPAPTPTTTPVADKDVLITLPIPMIDIGIAKTALPSLGKQGTKGTLATKEAGTLQVPERSIDASGFDIAGILLGANPNEAKEAATQYGFTKVDESYAIPKFLIWRYRDICKEAGYLIYNATQDCIKAMAEEKGERYISEISLSKPETKEKIKVFFTSNFGDNMAYKIVYVTEGDYSLGTSTEAVYKKRQRRKLFWQRVLEKYGMPSDTMRMIWTAGFDKPSLKAMMHRSTTNGQLVLESPSITDKDSYAMYKLNRGFSPLKDFSF